MSDEIKPMAVPTAEDELRGLLDRARRGDREALPALRTELDRHPEIWRAYGDLAAHAKDAWIGLASGPDLAMKESLSRKFAAIRDEAAGPTPSPLESLLANRVAACWLQAHYADEAAARVADASVVQADFARKRQDSAHRRYLSAIAALAAVRKLLASAANMATTSKLGIQIADLQAVPGSEEP